MHTKDHEEWVITDKDLDKGQMSDYSCRFKQKTIMMSDCSYLFRLKTVIRVFPMSSGLAGKNNTEKMPRRRPRQTKQAWGLGVARS